MAPPPLTPPPLPPPQVPKTDIILDKTLTTRSASRSCELCRLTSPSPLSLYSPDLSTAAKSQLTYCDRKPFPSFLPLLLLQAPRRPPSPSRSAAAGLRGRRGSASATCARGSPQRAYVCSSRVRPVHVRPVCVSRRAWIRCPTSVPAHARLGASYAPDLHGGTFRSGV